MRSSFLTIGCFLATLVASRAAAPAADAYAERAQDEIVIETLLRLDGFDLNASEKAKSAVLRFVRYNVGSPRFFELVRRFQLPNEERLLMEVAAGRPTESEGVEAARLLLAAEDEEAIAEMLTAADERAEKIVTALGLTQEPGVIEKLLPLLTDVHRSAGVRTAAARAIGRQAAGEKELLALAVSGKLPDDLRFTAANILHASADGSIRTAAAKLLPLPASASTEPLPPLAELVTVRGDAVRGREVFRTVGTCANCHTVAGEGKQVGPDLSEIGSKLSREAMFVAILDPSAGISHNYETYQAVLDNGTLFSGVKLSETDEAVTLKSAEAIVRAIPRAHIEELSKQSLSLMPADLQKVLTVQQLVDVVEYLATLKNVQVNAAATPISAQ